MASLSLPNEWKVRGYQCAAWDYLVDGGKRAVLIWPRRHGKDSISLNFTSYMMCKRPGQYLHLLPTQKRARRVIWDGRDNSGRKFIDQAFPPAIRKRTLEDQMLIEYVPMHGDGVAGSIWQLAGSDQIDGVVGSNTVGVVFSEYSQTDPRAWAFVAPILNMNGGWALFQYTVRGKNHGYSLYQNARNNPRWFAQLFTVDDTQEEIDAIRAAEGVEPIMDAIDDERASGIAEELIRQEYWNDWDVPMPGAIFAHEYTQAVDEGRIGDFPPIEGVPVETAWDLGRGQKAKHKTAIWFFQRDATQIRIVKYYESFGQSISWYWDKCKEFQQIYGWEYGHHWGPHDFIVKDWSTDRTRLETAASIGLDITRVANLGVEDQHNAVRVLFPRFVFWESECRNTDKEGGDGLASLASYQFEEDETKSTPQQKFFKPNPLDNWATDGAAAFRYLAVAFTEHIEQIRPVEPRWDYTFEEQIEVMKQRRIG